ncbi:hypothetical protein Taro_029524 [Colocasia esculenta]|uniref:Uncharacterized protein n=1 Tax=Colocasia esculenta TaxID=4460 RepID=A0A843VLL8_COLES|nr:hypothetical protein [Colocasia esculenta]
MEQEAFPSIDNNGGRVLIAGVSMRFTACRVDQRPLLEAITNCRGEGLDSTLAIYICRCCNQRLISVLAPLQRSKGLPHFPARMLRHHPCGIAWPAAAASKRLTVQCDRDEAEIRQTRGGGHNLGPFHLFLLILLRIRSWAEICCFGCTCLQLFWPKIVLRKWLNISTRDSDFSADESDVDSQFEYEGSSAIEDAFAHAEMCGWERELHDEGRKVDERRLGKNENAPAFRRRKSETLRAQYINTKELRHVD